MQPRPLSSAGGRTVTSSSLLGRAVPACTVLPCSRQILPGVPSLPVGLGLSPSTSGRHSGDTLQSCRAPSRPRVLVCSQSDSGLAVEQAAALQLPPLMLDMAHLPTLQDMQEVLPHLSPKQLADAIWTFAKHDVKPTTEFLDAIANEILSKLSHFKCQDLSNTLWAFAMLNHQPDSSWWSEFERQVYLNLTDFTDRELANLLWSMAVLGQQPSWLLDNLLSCSAVNFDSYSATSLHLVLWSLGKLSYVPSDTWLQSYLKAAQVNFFKFTPSELANVVWAFARLGVKLPTMWMDNFLMVAQWRFPSFGARLLSIVVWSAATLNHRPQQDWLVCFEEQVREKFTEFSGHELACVAWALRKFGYTTENNAVFYLLDKQQKFLDSDFEILSNSKLLRQLLGWKSNSHSAGSSA